MIDMTDAGIGTLWVTRGDQHNGQDVVRLDGEYDGGWIMTIIQTDDKQWLGERFGCRKIDGRIYPNGNDHAWDIMHEFKYDECPY